MSETFVLSQIRLEVMKTDLGEMNWDEAKKACKELGGDWRLPTIEELKTIYKYKDRIGGFESGVYWSSAETDDGYAWYCFFDDGLADYGNKTNPHYARAVRDL
jgi:hypothetical protein